MVKGDIHFIIDPFSFKILRNSKLFSIKTIPWNEYFVLYL